MAVPQLTAVRRHAIHPSYDCVLRLRWDCRLVGLGARGLFWPRCFRVWICIGAYVPTVALQLLPLWVMFACLGVTVPYIAVAIVCPVRPRAELRLAAREGRLTAQGDATDHSVG